MGDIIRIKPHHFIDIITALGEGQTTYAPHPYGHALHKVADSIVTAYDTPLLIELGADDICQPCKHNINGLCDDTIDTSFRPEAPSSKRLYNLLIDNRWCERLSLAQGDRLTSREFCIRLRDRSGSLTDIYREVPPSHAAQRERDLEAGIRSFLSGEAARRPKYGSSSGRE
jgi:hypothetical protein